MPTQTLVIQSTRPAPGRERVDSRRYPIPALGRIGTWSDTTHLPAESALALATRVQVALGPLTGAMRRANPWLVSLAPLAASGSSASFLASARSLAHPNDGLLILSAREGSRLPLALSQLRSALPDKLLVLDAALLTSGSPPVEIDGVCFCSFLRTRNSPLTSFRSATDWKKELDALAHLSGSFRGPILVETPLDTPVSQGGTGTEDWFEYALGSFLLATNSTRAYFSFQGTAGDQMMLDSRLQVSLGSPVEAYHRVYGVYVRHFQGGIVVVNPANAPAEMPLPRTYRTSFGTVISTARPGPQSALILLTVQ